jgi:RND family efflux transporter MFP subunit
MSHEPPEMPGPPKEALKPVRTGPFIIVLVILALGAAAYGIRSRGAEHENLARWTSAQAMPTVALAALQHDNSVKEVVLPGDVEAFYSASIHGQASGYVREWRADIGAEVHKGDILAVVETPELDDRITMAEGELAKAKANQTLAKVTAERWATLRGTSAVSQQAVDEKQSDMNAKDADVSAVQANLSRLLALKGFSNILAPFDGVVTARNVDIGSLVTEATSPGASLFTVADVHKMRIYVRAPESYAAALKVGMKAKLVVPEYPERTFDAEIATTSHAIDPKSRSLLVELLADNADGLLSPGAFAQVRFQIPPDPQAVRAPASALLFRNEATYIATLDADNRVRLNKVQIKRDYGAEVEISGDLPANARIIASLPESISAGEEVRVAGDDGAHKTADAETELAQSRRDGSE